MASIKLTNDIRDAILGDMLKHRFAEEYEKLADDRATLALAVYNDCYGETGVKRLKSLPDGWLPTDTGLRARFGGEYEHIPFNGSFYTRDCLLVKRDPVCMPVAAKDSARCYKSYEADHPIAQTHAKLDARKRGFEERLETTRQQVRAALARATTSNRLKELWPEAAPFLKRWEKDAPQLPTVPVRKLNEMLGLPVEEAA